MSAFPALAAQAGPGRLEPYFQPVARLADGALVGFEALARWRRVDGSVAEASAFLPKGPWTDENAEIGRAVAAEAIDVFSVRASPAMQGDEPAPEARSERSLTLAVNIIGADLFDGTAQRLAAQASLSGMAPGALVMELTEHHALSDLNHAAEALAGLRARGVKIALDDFGTGHSSLAWLARLPVDAIKIDKDFVRRIGEGGSEYKIVAALLSLAREFGLQTIAEGVETEAERAALVACGCDHGQGRLYAMPLPAREAFALLDGH
jgi:EAL domain-containing protein (putative c-di-GMP-specific phosphodiesterase class I)